MKTRSSEPNRRGNAMILVTGVLVLLAILATSFITRTQAGRITGIATQQAATFDNNADIIARTVAQELADGLFAWPVDPTTVGGGVMIDPPPVDANAQRFAPAPGALRYGVDPTDELDNETGLATGDANGDLIPDGDGRPDYPYNFPPYWTVPYTNWPDEPAATVDRHWPQGPGSPNGFNDPFEGNPVGQPGTGDCRALRDLEPMRWDTNGNGIPDAFMFWRHLSNLSRPNNGLRICSNISDVFDSNLNLDGTRGDEIGGLVLDLNIPVEQWPVSRVPDPGRYFNSLTGDARIDQAGWSNTINPSNEHSDLTEQWQIWFTSYLYDDYYDQPDFIPQNFINLKDPNANGNPHEPGERPRDEFRRFDSLGRPSLRWQIGCHLTDTDGDGYTDALWHLMPTPIERGIRQIVAFSMTDNCGMVNANVASRFEPFTTAGETPADVALIGQNACTAGPNCWSAAGQVVPAGWPVGFFDAPHNWEYGWDYPDGFGPPWNLPDGVAGLFGNAPVVFHGRPAAGSQNQGRWVDFREALGFDSGNPDDLFDPLVRRLYWLRAGSRPLSPAHLPGDEQWWLRGLTPFTYADELELRMYHGQNTGWAFSRFEDAVNDAAGSQLQFLRGWQASRTETTEFVAQLWNPELLHDPRRKITLFSGARNDLVPPWLWWRYGLSDPDPLDSRYRIDLDEVPTFVRDQINLDPAREREIIEAWLAQCRRKIDLREQDPNPATFVPPPGQGYLHERLPWLVLHALSVGDERSLMDSGAGDIGDIGEADDDFSPLYGSSAAYSANLLAYRDEDDAAPLHDDFTTTPATIGAIPLPESDEVQSPRPNDRYLGLERQPFLLEAFVAHVYEAELVPPNEDDSTNQPPESGVRPFVDRASEQHSIIVVQIANPFRATAGSTYDEGIDLMWLPPGQTTEQPLYFLRVAGREVPVRPNWNSGTGEWEKLWPATEDRPCTAIVYSIPSNDLMWRDFLDIQPTDHPQEDAITGDPRETIFIDVRALPPTSQPVWPTDRDVIDDFAEAHNGLNDPEHFIELLREDRVTGERVVIDRIDPSSELAEPNDNGARQGFAVSLGATGRLVDELVRLAADTNLPPARNQFLPPPPAPGDPFLPAYVDGVRLEPGKDLWVQWASVSRAWGNDFGFDICADDTWGIQPDERAPRFVMARQYVQSMLDEEAAYASYHNEYFSDPPADLVYESIPDDRVLGQPLTPRVEREVRLIRRYGQGVREGDETPLDVWDIDKNRWGFVPEIWGAEIDLASAPDGLVVPGADPEFPWIDHVHRSATLEQIREKLGQCSAPPTPAPQMPYTLLRRKPTFFNMNSAYAPVPPPGAPPSGLVPPDVHGIYPDYDDPDDGYHRARLMLRLPPYDDESIKLQAGCPDKPFAFFDHSLQMLQKDGDFQQVGEILNVWLFTHRLRFETPPPPPGLAAYIETVQTFSEYLDPDQQSAPFSPGAIIGQGAAGEELDPLHAIPDLPAGYRMLDAFVCDGIGVNVSPTAPDRGDFLFRNAQGFTGRMTPGLINPNTASVEVLRTLPHWYKPVHRSINGPGAIPLQLLPRTAVAEAAISYREHLSNALYVTPQGLPLNTALHLGSPQGPDYRDRAPEQAIQGADKLRADRGFASIGELALIDKNGDADTLDQDTNNLVLGDLMQEAWSIGFAGRDPFDQLAVNSSVTVLAGRLSTDVVGPDGDLDSDDDDDFLLGDDFVGDNVANDSEEQNLLFSGVSNLITTRSDTFTVYFKIRSFRQNPVTGVWDATDPEQIIDESRYVMLVDRSEVNRPGDKPKIRYIEKLPN